MLRLIGHCGALVLAMGMLGGCAAANSGASAADSMHSIVKPILTQALPEKLGTEARMLTVEYPPGVVSPPHRHPGTVFVYVLEGAVECALDDGPVVRYEKGQAWYERPNQLHRVAKNASQTERAKLVVFFLTDPGKPVLEPQK